MGEPGEVKLLRSWSSIFGLRIVWALKLKGIEFETVLEDLANKSPLLLESNPVHKKIPVLIHKGKPISESLVILEYIDETWKENSLLPQDPLEKAAARFWAKFHDDKLLPSVWQVFVSQGKKQEELVVSAIENLKFIEEQLKGKKYFGGEKIGYLDIVVGWMADMVSILEDIAGLKLINEETLPLLSAWKDLVSDIPVVKESCPPRDELVAKFQAIRDAYLSSAPSV